MSNIHAIEFVYPTGALLSITDKSFKEAVRLVLNGTFIKNTPIKVVFPSTKKTLYFDDDHFRNFIQENINQEELIELTQCEGLYRNKTNYFAEGHYTVEAGALWKLDNKQLILIDNDALVVSKFDVDVFQSV